MTKRDIMLVLVLICLGLFAVTGTIQAQAKTQPDVNGYLRFEKVGSRLPLGINVVRQFGDVLVLGANRELVQSRDSGLTWTPVLTALQHKNITAINVFGNDILVGTATGGVYRTTNEGLYWERFSTDNRLRKVSSLLRTSNGYVASNDSGLCFTRRDKDTVWQVLPLPAPCLAFAMFDEIPWFICENGAVLASTDRGLKVMRNVGSVDRATLVPINSKLAVVYDTSVIVIDADADSLAMWPVPIPNWTACIAFGSKLLVGGRSTGLRSLHLKTGEVTTIFSGPAEQENISALAVSGDSVVIGTSRSNGRCYVVSEGSKQWHALNPNWLRGTFDVTDLICENGTVYVATREEGVHVGRVSQASLSPIHDAYEQTIFTQLIPWRNDMLIVSRRSGLWRMKNGLSHPEWFTRSLPATFDYYATTVGSRVLAGINNGRILWSDDDGKSWTQSDDSLPDINQLSSIGETSYASTLMGLYRSDDKGETWRAVDGPFRHHNILWTSGTQDTLFTTSTEATYRQLGGSDFTKLEAEFTPGMIKHFTTVLLHDGLLFATGAPAVYVSTDVGNTWLRKTFDGANAVVSQFFYKSFYYVFTDRGDMYRSSIP